MRSVKLGDIIKLEYGKPLPESERQPNGAYPAFGANGVKAWTNRYFYDKESIIVGRKGSAGELTLTDGKFWPLDVTYFVTHDDQATDLRYIYHLLKTLNLPSMARGVKPGINRNDIYAINVRLPSLQEQKQVVAKLNAAFELIDKAILMNQKNIANSKTILESLLKDSFGRQNSDWSSATLGTVTSKIGSGATPKGGKGSYKEDGICLIRSLNVYDTYFKYDQLAHLSEEQANKLNNVALQKDDILINITGASIARCNLVPENCLPGRVNQHVSIIRLDQTKINPRFLHYELISASYKEQLLGIGDGKGSTRQAITKTQLQDFKINYPLALEEQASIAVKIDDVLDTTKKLSEKYKKKHKLLSDLRRSMLSRAFEIA